MVNTIVQLHVCLIYYTGIPASLYSHSHTIDSTISHQPIATIWGSPRSFYHHVGGSASMIPRSGAAAADWWIWPIRSAFRSFDNGRNIRYLTAGDPYLYAPDRGLSDPYYGSLVGLNSSHLSPLRR